MKLVRPMVLALALTSTLVLAAGFEDAHAQAPTAIFEAPGSVEIVPPGHVVGDGSTAVKVHVIALDSNGAPMTGLKLKVEAAQGAPGAFTEVGGGMYAFEWTPPKVAGMTPVAVSVKGKTANGRANLNATYNVPVQASAVGGATVKANPASLVLGTDTEATVSFTLPAGAEAKDLKVTASSGTIEAITALGAGKFTARYKAPAVNYPHLAIISVADARDPSRVYAHAAVPLNGKTDYPVTAPAGSTVILRIGGREFGPVAADAAGRAAVPVIVPPGIAQATQVTVTNGQSAESAIDLRIPPTNRIRMLPGYAALPAGGPVPVRAVVYTPDGNPDTGASVAFTATGGTIGPATHEGNGVYVAQLTPTVTTAKAAGTVSVSLQGGADVQKDSLSLSFLPAVPDMIALRVEPVTLPAGVNAFKVFAKVTRGGTGLPGRTVLFNGPGSNLQGSVADLGNGDYRADFLATGTGNIDMLGTVQNPASGNALAQVVAFPVQQTVTNDGSSTVGLTVLALDSFGYPLANVPITLTVEEGGGTAPASLTTNGFGLAQGAYKAGAAADMAKIRATSGTFTDVVTVYQVPAGTAVPAIPVSGSQAEVARVTAGRGLVAQTRVMREGAGTAVAAAPVPTGPVGALATLSAVANPPQIAPGGTVAIEITAKDASGMGVGGQTLEFIPSAGSVGSVSDAGGGTYRVALTVPPNATGEVKLAVSSADGGVSTVLKVPVSGDVALGSGAWGTVTDPTTGQPAGTANAVTPPTPAVEQPIVKEPKPPGEHPWLRARASYVASSYRYQQEPLVADGPLLPVILAIGGERGEKAATPQGFEVAARAFLDNVDVPYVGFDAGLRATFYGITAPQFNGAVAPDTLTNFHANVIGRYPFDVDGNQFHVGARAGLQLDDFIYFTGSFETGSVEYATLMLPSLALGAEIGADVGDVFFVGGVHEGLAYGSNPYETGVDINLGYDFTDNLFADLGFAYLTRKTVIVGATSERDVGELTDGQTMFKLGLGWSM